MLLIGDNLLARKDDLYQLLKPVVEGMGCDFWGMDYIAQGKRSLLRIYIDKESGVLVDDCEKVSRQISAILDVEDPIKGEYTLEVSSPGWDRPLFNVEQYKAYIGSIIEVRLQAPFNGRRKFKGLLAAVENDEIVLQVDAEEFIFPVETIDKANVVPQY
ncbi:ribosome maturation factor RimP [Hahella chejuensis]|uniref:ribosome maturation factor RimP n=1 Tax=Hahella chejuensis TaxID=158327 RepID=UPI0005A102CC|nr:ribosome maturation factor RimP [Hahella chejuensis]